ncbi:DUF6896 domain-containing protein [Pedobacter steynii]|uniref:DUF6896 domain-containing protein n=1 Tax=Pedobacter steynii TaxID=430522 RepID=UPI003B5863D1
MSFNNRDLHATKNHNVDKAVHQTHLQTVHFPELRHDGFDLWRLKNFIQNQRNKFPNYRDATKVEKEFNDLIKKVVIIKPKLINSTSLYFFKSTLKTGTINKTERRVENNESLRKSFQSWWKKISNR